MTKKERIISAIKGGEVDRTPISVWRFFPDVDQNPRALAEAHVDFVKKYDFDFIKLSPFALYTVEDWGCKIKYSCSNMKSPVLEERVINSIEDWNYIHELPAYYGTMGKQVQFTENVYRLVKDNIPFIQTLFSPLTTAHNLAGDRIFEDIKTHPELVHNALKSITNTTINFVMANIEAGVSGFFFATKCASYSMFSGEEYEEFGSVYDLQILNAFTNKTWFNVLHMHGEELMFEKLLAYPCNCLNWSDKWAKPDLKEARNLTDKCLIGGINEKDTICNGTEEDLKSEIQWAIKSLNNKGLMIGPGCVADLATPDRNFYASRLAVESEIHKYSF